MRALAALFVAFTHILNDAIIRSGDPSGRLAAIQKFMPWDAGVDIFFVISGFIIIHASTALFATPGGPLVFLRRRLTRIVPLYWIVTTLFMVTLLFTRTVIHGDIGGPAYIAASYFFIPWPRPDGVMQPAFGLGWTLNYEMFFYFALTPFLLLPRFKAVAAVAALFCLFVAVGQFNGFQNLQLAYWSRPIILEFAAGMLIALLYTKGCKVSGYSAFAIAFIALVALHLAPLIPAGWRPLTYGLPAFALVAVAAFVKSQDQLGRLETCLVRLGGASYAMYLFHPFIIRSFTVLWHRFHVVNGLVCTMYILFGLAVAQICALLIHIYIEPKLYAVLRRKAGVEI